MRTIEIPDEVYEGLTKIADEEGTTVQSLVSEVLGRRILSSEDLGRFFTSEIVADLERIAENMANGEGFSEEEVEQRFAERKARWIRDNAA